MKKKPITTHLFVDIGGVLLSNGWDHEALQKALTAFKIKDPEIMNRHHQIFDTYEEGKLSLKDYLNHVIFYKKRPVTSDQFQRYMFDQSTPDHKMLKMIGELKARYKLKIVVISNEGYELNAHRIEKFKLDSLVDTFVSSCFVHLRKPDPEIFQLALDITQAKAEQVVYIDDISMFVQIAEILGIKSILHTDYKSTSAKLAAFGLRHC